MAYIQDFIHSQRAAHGPSRQAEGKRPQGIKREASPQVRRSARISQAQECVEDKSFQRKPPITEEQHSPPPPQSRKRRYEVEKPTDSLPAEELRKRLCTSPPSPVAQPNIQEAVSKISTSQRSHISYWAENQDWPTEYFQQPSMWALLARKKSTLLSRKRSQSSLATSATPATPSDQRPREEKTAPYTNAAYAILLEKQGNSYMKEDRLGICDSSQRLCDSLLENEQPIPEGTVFRDNDTFRTLCDKLQGKNEARIFKDLTPLLVPSAETLATLGAKHLENVVESVNEGWNNCVPVTNPRPQPDYAVGFAREAFSEDQQRKLQPYTGDVFDISYLMATFYMHFPFLTCEVKCGSAGLDIADRQNAHSMTVTMIGIYMLFKGVKREQELHRRILGFSISHDDESVRIWGHYPVIDGDQATFRRHSIRKFNFTERKGLERWTTYKFTKNVYDLWTTSHFQWICSAVNDIPDNAESQPSAANEPHISETTGLSQPLAAHSLGASNNQTSVDDLQPLTPDESTQLELPASKKKRGT